MNEEDTKGEVKIIAMRGLPRSGKSTVAARISRRFGHPIVSRDALRLAVHGSAFNADMENVVSGYEAVMMKALAYAGHKVIILDECNVDAVKSEARIRERFEGTDFELEIQFAIIDTPIDVCCQRARDCNQEYLVPVIKRMWASWTL